MGAGKAGVCPRATYLLPVFLAILVFVSSCATFPTGGRAPAEGEQQKRLEIVRYTRGLLGRKDLAGGDPRFKNDCSGLVLGVFRTLGYEVELTHTRRVRFLSDAIYRSLNERGFTYVNFRPKPADLVFFKKTVAGSGDFVTHVGIVDAVLPDKTVVILNYTSPGVTELKMNLLDPHVHKTGAGRVKNDYLKQKTGSGTDEKRLSGELFFSFGDLLSYSLMRGEPPSRSHFE